MNIVKCKRCGKEFENFWGKDLEEAQMCFHCKFWTDLLEEDKQRDPHEWCVINGTHYIIGDENQEGSSASRGFGGSKFHIIFDDGYEVDTTNLWCQGDIDEDFIKYFPNNAKFDWEWKKYPSGTEYLVKKDEKEI